MSEQLDLNLDSAPRTLPLEDGELFYWPAFLPHDSADYYVNLLRDTLNWAQDHLVIAGRQIAIPRLQAWYGDPGANYQYSGLNLPAQPWTTALQSLRGAIEAACGQRFNSLLANCYRSGQDSVGWHSDDEPELGPQPVIASLSLGATRTFQLKHKRKPLRQSLDLCHGDLLVMRGALQHHWRHQVPKTRHAVGERINLTFRTILTPDPQ